MAAPLFITDDVLLGAVESLLKVAKGSIVFNAPFWGPIVKASNQAASNEIYRQLTARGFIASQIAAWDHGAEFATDIGLFWALAKGAGLAGYDDKIVKAMDRRVELRTVQVLVNNVFQYPTGPPLAVGTGGFDGTGDFFGTPVDPDDTRLGDVVQF